MLIFLNKPKFILLRKRNCRLPEACKELGVKKITPFDLHVLGAPPAFVLSQDQTLYKWYLITYKVLNRCNHSDTIACVLYELLVNLELINVGFQTHDQGSTSFSFVQFSRSCCAVSSRWQLVNYTTSGSVCQELFWSFFGFFGSFSTPAKPAQAVVMGFSAPVPRGTAWLYYHRLSYFVNRFFQNFWNFSKSCVAQSISAMNVWYTHLAGFVKRSHTTLVSRTIQTKKKRTIWRSYAANCTLCKLFALRLFYAL